MIKNVLILLLLASSQLVTAQVKINYLGGEVKNYYGVNCPCFEVTVNGAEKQTTEELTNDWFDDKTKNEVVVFEKHKQIDNLFFENRPTDTLFARWNTIPVENGAAAIVQFGNKQNTLNHDDQVTMLQLKGYLKNLGNTIYLNVLEGKLEVQEDELKNYQKNKKSWTKNLEKIKEEVVELEAEINQANQKIISSKNEEELLTEKIAKDKSIVLSKEGEARKLAQDQLKEDEKARKALFKEKEDLHKDIVEYEAEIRELEFELKETQSKLNVVNEKLIKQNQLVSETEQELEQIDALLK